MLHHILPLTLLTLLSRLPLSSQHARLMEPPSRASMWRVGFPTPKDQDDNQSYCGGFGVQYHQNGGRCGICGDPWHSFPRQHEAPHGIYANGIVTKTYRQGSLIPVIVDITANHQGHFIFKLCPNNNIFEDPGQECFDQLPLSTGLSNQVKFPINDYVTGLRLLYVQLPLRVVCEQCILQWSYVAGNNWGLCSNGTSGMGCGPQETFRSCADIRIVPHPMLRNFTTHAFDAIHATSPVSLRDFTRPVVTPPAQEGDEYAIDFLDLAPTNEQSQARRKDLLRRKTLLLEKALVRLQELILETSEKDESDSDSTSRLQLLEEMRAEESEQKFFSEAFGGAGSDSEAYSESHDDGMWRDNEVRTDGNPWYNRIISNRHKK